MMLTEWSDCAFKCSKRSLEFSGSTSDQRHFLRMQYCNSLTAVRILVKSLIVDSLVEH